MMRKIEEQSNSVKRVTEVCTEIQMLTTEVNAVLLGSFQSNKYYFCMKEKHICLNCKKYWELIDIDKVYINEN